jgi:hypothetical protein
MKFHGNDLTLGNRCDGQGVLTLPGDRRSEHLYVCGATGTGKSKFLENLIRQDLIAWPKHQCGLMLLDPHGSLFDSVMAWLAWKEIGDLPVIPIDLRRSDWIVSYNLLRKRKNADAAVIVNQFVQAMAYVWGEDSLDRTPRFARWASNIISTLYANELTLLEAEYLIDAITPEAKRVRRGLAERLPERAIATRDWLLADAFKPNEMEDQIGSTVNRLRRFLETHLLRQMFGQKGPSLDLGAALREGHIVLVSLATEGNLVSDENAALFATLLLSDLWVEAKNRGKDKESLKPFRIFVDEFQNFVTPTIAKNLDQSRGYGLNWVLSHQFPNQLLHAGANGKQVYDSVFVNARSKVVFSMEGEENLRPLTQSLFMGVWSPDKIKDELYSTKVMSIAEEMRRIYGRSSMEGSGTAEGFGQAAGQGLGGTEIMPYGETIPTTVSRSYSQFASHSKSTSNSEWVATGKSEADVPVFIPQFGKELSSRQFESIDEQMFRSMAALHDQEQRHCVARVVGARAPVSLYTPNISALPVEQTEVDGYTRTLLQRFPFSRSAHDATIAISQCKLEMLSAKVARAIEEPTTAKRTLPLKVLAEKHVI